MKEAIIQSTFFRKLLLKSFLITVFLLLVQAKNTMAQTPYARISYYFDSSHSSAWYGGGIAQKDEFYTIILSFYQDAAGSIPWTGGTPQVTLSYHLQDNCGPVYTDPALVTAYDTDFTNNPYWYNGERTYDNSSGVYTTAAWYSLEPGDGYLLCDDAAVGQPWCCGWDGTGWL